MTDSIAGPTHTETARAAAVSAALDIAGVSTVFPPTVAVLRSLASRPISPVESLRLLRGAAGTEAKIDIAVDAGHRATDVAWEVQQCVQQVLAGHGIEAASVAVTVLEHGPATPSATR